MARFVSAFGNKTFGFPRLNLDHVAKLRQVTDKKAVEDNGPCFDCEGRDGEVIGRVAAEHVEPEPRIVANHEACDLVEFFLDVDGEEKRLGVARTPVLAWKVEGDRVAPVTCMPAPTWPWMLHFRARAIWVDPLNETVFDSADAALTFAAEEIREECDEK